jgi:inner membrane protein
MAIKAVSLKNNNTIKLLIIFFIILLMLIPLAMVEDLISERDSMRAHAEEKISQGWGKAQVISGPVLKIPYKARYLEKKVNKNGETHNIYRYEVHHVYLLTDKLMVDNNLSSEIRYLGIYEMPVYLNQASINAQFSPEDLIKLTHKYEQILWNQAEIILPLTDPRGLRQLTVTSTQAKKNDSLKFSPYQTGNHLQGIIAEYPINFTHLKSDQSALNVSVDMVLAGSKALNFQPFGRVTQVTIKADWHSPGFYGEFLPSERTITTAGFSAAWQILELNRKFPQTWVDNQINWKNVSQSDFGLKLVQPANLYQQNHRSIKYAVLFIALTFITFFLFELFFKKKLHPLHYFFTGGALSTFYLLLIAFSEHLGFTQAYSIATIAITLLMGGYSQSIFKSRPYGLLNGFIIFLLYGFFYILMQSQENALLLGAVAFFTALALTMYLTRNINWYDDTDNVLNKV